MKKQLRQITWWRLAPTTIAVVAVVYVAIAESLSAGVLAVIAVAAAVLTVWNPFEARPKPQLTLRLPGGEESQTATIGGPRTVDIEAVVESARVEALAAKPMRMFLSLQGFAQPSASDYENYERDVGRYEEKVRRWAESAREWLAEQGFLLEARVVTRNPSSVDAHNAGVYVNFPKGTEEASETAEPPKPPTRPAFPLRRSAIEMALSSGAGGMRDWYPPVGRGFAVTPHIPVAPISIWEPDYERREDGGLRIGYCRQTIHHGESDVAGRPFQVQLPPGHHLVKWEVHAANLPQHASGSWQVSASASDSERIASLVELQTALGIEAGGGESEEG